MQDSIIGYCNTPLRSTTASASNQYIKFNKLQPMAALPIPMTAEHLHRAINELDFNFLCHASHEGLSCNRTFALMIQRGLKPVIRTYLPVHIVPFLLFKRRKFMKNPLLELFKLLVGILRSVLFGVGYYSFYKRSSCFLLDNRQYNDPSIVLSAMLGGIPLIFQAPGRQAEIALFSVYKSMEILYNMGKRRKLPVTIPAGNCVMTGLALCIICYHYFNNRDMIKKSYADIIDKLLGDS